MIKISGNVSLADDEVELHAIRSQGAGGQNVNKVASAIHLRFDIAASSLPEFYKERLLKLNDKRISKEGVLVIKAQQFRTQEKNRDDAISRLQELIQSIAHVQRARLATQPTKAAKSRRIDSKTRRGKSKLLRRKIDSGDQAG